MKKVMKKLIKFFKQKIKGILKKAGNNIYTIIVITLIILASLVIWQKVDFCQFETKDIFNFASIFIPFISLIATIIVASSSSRKQIESFKANTQTQINSFETQIQRIVEGLQSVSSTQTTTTQTQITTFENKIGDILTELKSVSKNQTDVSNKQIESFDTQTKLILEGFKTISDKQEATLKSFNKQTNAILNGFKTVSKKQEATLKSFNEQTNKVADGFLTVSINQERSLKKFYEQTNKIIGGVTLLCTVQYATFEQQSRFFMSVVEELGKLKMISVTASDSLQKSLEEIKKHPIKEESKNIFQKIGKTIKNWFT